MVDAESCKFNILFTLTGFFLSKNYRFLRVEPLGVLNESTVRLYSLISSLLIGDASNIAIFEMEVSRYGQSWFLFSFLILIVVLLPFILSHI